MGLGEGAVLFVGDIGLGGQGWLVEMTVRVCLVVVPCVRTS